jgi:Protein of unknown function (DUF3142)
VNHILKVTGVLALTFGIALLSLDATHNFASSIPGTPTRLKRLDLEPRVMIWAWEYPADLNAIDKDKVGVAYLAGKFILQSDSVIVKPRLQKLIVPLGTFMMAVVRIEPDRAKNAANFSDAQLNALTNKIISLLSSKEVQVLQIDFDARVSERPFYRRLLSELRKQVPTDMPISITALASWCLGDNWLTDTNCDQVVPMFFSMGKDRERMVQYLQKDPEFKKFPKPISLGLSIDEPDVLAQLAQITSPIFLFSTNGWESDHAKEWIKKFQNGGSNWKDLAKLN